MGLYQPRPNRTAIEPINDILRIVLLYVVFVLRKNELFSLFWIYYYHIVSPCRVEKGNRWISPLMILCIRFLYFIVHYLISFSIFLHFISWTQFENDNFPYKNLIKSDKLGRWAHCKRRLRWWGETKDRIGNSFCIFNI